MKNETIANIDACRLIANMKGFSADTLLYSVEALIKGGIKAVEVEPDELSEQGERDCIIKINGLKKCFGKDLSVGAANVFTERMVKLAKGAGADFISAPSVNNAVLARAGAVGVCTMAGAFTATEIERAINLNSDYVRLFPANIGGNADYAALMAETFKDTKLMAAGKLSFEDITPLWKAGIKYFSIGGSLANVTLANKQEYGIMTNEAARYCDLINKLK